MMANTITAVHIPACCRNRLIGNKPISKVLCLNLGNLNQRIVQLQLSQASRTSHAVDISQHNVSRFPIGIGKVHGIQVNIAADRTGTVCFAGFFLGGGFHRAPRAEGMAQGFGLVAVIAVCAVADTDGIASLDTAHGVGDLILVDMERLGNYGSRGCRSLYRLPAATGQSQHQRQRQGQ